MSGALSGHIASSLPGKAQRSLHLLPETSLSVARAWLSGFAGFENMSFVPDSLLVCDSQQHLAS